MADELFSEVDEYVVAALHGDDAVLESALAASRKAGLPEIQVSPTQGKLLHLIARAIAARRILELGTLGGYSAIWLGRALPEEGRMITLEVSSAHAEVAAANLDRAGLSSRVEIRLGDALDSLAALANEGAEPFDLVFIDADKPPAADYLAATLPLCHPGSLIVIDNVVRRGEVLDPASQDPNVIGVRRLFEALAHESRLEATALQTVGLKGHDGFVLALVA